MLRVRPEGEVSQLFPGRVVASDVQGRDAQGRVLPHWKGSFNHFNVLMFKKSNYTFSLSINYRFSRSEASLTIILVIKEP